MNWKERLNHKRILAFLLVLTMISSLVTSVYATDDLDSLEESTSNLENELSTLNKDLKKISNEIDSISSQITDMNTRIEDTRSELAIAKGKEEAQYESMKSRIQFMYENGNSSLLEILFSSASIADFIRRAEYVSNISSYDRSALEKLADTRETIAQKETELAQEKKNLDTLLNDLDSKETTLQKKISSTSADLKTYTAKLEKAREEAQKAESSLNQNIIPVKPPVNTGNSGSSYTPPSYTASASDIELFAALIECEAGSSHYEGMLAVASVIVNRMNHPAYPNTLRGVIFARNQFPPATNGSVDRILQRGVRENCVQVAQDALAGKNNVGSCLSFRSASSGHAGTIIGGNVFF